MDLQTLLNERNLSKYQLSKLSGVPKTTIAPEEAIWSGAMQRRCKSWRRR